MFTSVCDHRLQAVLQRPLLSDPPPNMADYSPVVISGPSAQEMHLQPVFDQQLLAGYLLIVPPSLTQVSFTFSWAITSELCASTLFV